MGRQCCLTTRSSGPSGVIASAPRAPLYIVRLRRAAGVTARPLNASVRRPIRRIWPQRLGAIDQIPLFPRPPAVAVVARANVVMFRRFDFMPQRAESRFSLAQVEASLPYWRSRSANWAAGAVPILSVIGSVAFPLLGVADRITLCAQGLKAASVSWARGPLTTGSSGRQRCDDNES
jgi:hypothetical protein